MTIRDAKALNRLARSEIAAGRRMQEAQATGDHAGLLLAAKHLTRIPALIERRAKGAVTSYSG